MERHRKLLILAKKFDYLIMIVCLSMILEKQIIFINTRHSNLQLSKKNVMRKSVPNHFDENSFLHICINILIVGIFLLKLINKM